MKSKIGVFIIIAGLLCLTAALAFFVFNKVESDHAEESSEKIVSALQSKLGESEKKSAAKEFPTDNPDRKMPALSLEGSDYIGILSIPYLDLELPVLSVLTDDALQITPCLYSGSVYGNDMVIGAHNYDSHFGNISSLVMGASVFFTDAENNLYEYEVANIETLRPEQTEELTKKQRTNDWDLTMFTCNYSGSERITVRCNRIK